MRYHVLATDYDGTLAHHGIVDDQTIAVLERVRSSGRKLVLVTGRQLENLISVFGRLDLFEAAVVENGAVVYRSDTRAVRLLAEPPPPAFAEALRACGVSPLAVGRVIVATWQPHETTVLETIREMGLELQVIFNKGAVMALPSGINKAVGLRAALEELGLSPHNAVGVGDAQNDHAFLAECECAVAVANALPALKERADLVTAGDHGRGVAELAEALIASDLVELGDRLGRHLVLGEGPDGAQVALPPYGRAILVAGPSASGKSTLVLSLVEQLFERGYQFCIVDPEGDYADVEGATVLGGASRPPSITEPLEVLARPKENVVVNLLGLALADRPPFFEGLLSRLQEMRARTGRPHWLVIDEAHHLLPEGWRPSALTLPRELHGLLLVTVHPEHVTPALLSDVGVVAALGTSPAETFAGFAAAVGEPPARVHDEPLAPGEALVLFRAPDGEPALPVRVRVRAPRIERRRHVRKYAEGELGPDRSFYFHGPDGKLNLRAHNLQIFLQVADGVDDDTWLFHLRRGDYSRWLRKAIKDSELADEVAAVENDPLLGAGTSRARVRTAIEDRYTAPA